LSYKSAIKVREIENIATCIENING